ncbi:class I SAM-dependent methyltransferase [Thermodesulfobacteriota bacterium]
MIKERAFGVTCDLGAGDGYVIQRVKASQRIAVDIAYSYMEQLPEEIMRIWGRAEDVPMNSGCIDTMICTDVMEHVLDPQLLADEMRRLLKASGQILLAFPYKQDLSVYHLPAYQAKYGKYKYVHLRSIDDDLIAHFFPEYEIGYSHLISEGMDSMEFKPYPIKFVEMKSRRI